MKRTDTATVKIQLSGTELMQALRDYIEEYHPDVSLFSEVHLYSRDEAPPRKIFTDDALEVSWFTKKD